MVSLQPVTVETTFQDARPWLKFVERGDNQTVTLDVEAIDPATHVVNGRVISGLPLVKSTEVGKTSLYVIAEAAAEAEGVLFVSFPYNPAETRNTQAMLTRGTVLAGHVALLDAVTLPPTIRKEV